MLSSRGRALFSLTVVALIAGCGDDAMDPQTELVTVKGIVRNIDTGQPAPGVRVELLGTDYSDKAATGNDGAYLLQVPKGSRLYLRTDDFTPGTSDVWIPVINIEPVPVIADEDIPDYPIHSCPHTSCTSPASATWDGSVALWDHYLANADDQTNGDLFVPTTTNGSGGVVAILQADCTNSVRTRDSLSVSINAPEFPVGYTIFSKFNNGKCTGGPDFFHPGTRTKSDGPVISFGDPAFTGTQVTVTLVDCKAQPFRVFSPIDVPVRPGTLSIVHAKSVNGVAATFKEFACACINPNVFCTP